MPENKPQQQVPDQVPRELDEAYLEKAETTDEDRLGVDPLEEGIEPPEHWSEADRFGTTAYEQAEGESHAQRLAQEESDQQPPLTNDGVEVLSAEVAADGYAANSLTGSVVKEGESPEERAERIERL